jgi:UDP-hydrolysing UDP-N-acetyl-D-glucosamine 2-epimerase
VSRRIAVVTGTRADYGLLRWLLADLRDRDDVDLRLVVTGMHLAPDFGETWRVIEEDGFTIDARVDMQLTSDSGAGIAHATARGLSGLTDALEAIAPELVVVLGDRFEILAAAQACLFLGIPVAHIAGGELTEGAIDDAIRHAVTKMAHLHFVETTEYAERVVQLGESPERVFVVGGIGLDNLDKLTLLDRGDLEQELGIGLTTPLALCTFHPETLSGQSAEQAISPLFEAIDAVPQLQVVFTKGNADAGGRELNRLVDEFVAARPGRTAAFTSLGQLRYLSLMAIADLVLGNSSSGILEAPTAGTPTVNIGDRQRGRLRAPSVIDTPNEAGSIRDAILLALGPDVQQVAARRESPFGSAGASARIADVVATHKLDGILPKRFHDQGRTDDGRR